MKHVLFGRTIVNSVVGRPQTLKDKHENYVLKLPCIHYVIYSLKSNKFFWFFNFLNLLTTENDQRLHYLFPK